MDIQEIASQVGADPTIGGEFGVNGLIVYFGLFPLVSLKRRLVKDRGDARTGPSFIPKSIQPLAVGIMVVLLNGGASVVMGTPAVHSISAGLSAAAVAMMTYSNRKKRGHNRKDDE